MVFDKEYMRAIQQTFEYQRDIIQDSRGVTLQPTMPKLHMLFDVLRAGSGKVRKRFLANVVSRMDFDLPKLDFAEASPTALLFARFVVENLAFFDYVRIDEILHLVACLEKLVVHGVGTTVAHAIEVEVLKVHLAQASQDIPDPTQQSLPDPSTEQPATQPREEMISPSRLRHLTVASMILSMVWETRTHLRQLWGLAKQSKNAVKPAAKDLNKPATKTAFYRSELLEKIESIMGSLEDPVSQLAQCKVFAELVAVDHEHKVASEDDEEAELARQAAGYETPDEGETASQPSSTGRGRKRKGSAGPAGTPSAKRKRGTGAPKSRPRGGGGTGNRRRSKTASTEGDGEGGWD
jgi:cohesin loading factor subunit SCC2